METVNTSDRLASLRKLMSERGVDIYIVPSEDSHHSEYSAPCDDRRAFLSGFTGSSGCAIVTTDKAILSTDGRYFNQASKQLDKNWTLLKQGLPESQSWQDWTSEQSSKGKTVAVDPSLISGSEATALRDSIKKCGGAGLRPLEENLVDIVWGSSRPDRPNQPITSHPDNFAGKSVEQKLRQVRDFMAKKNTPLLAISTLDDIAWLFNLRGADIPFNPVFFSYAVVTEHSAILYILESKVSTECRDHLRLSGVEVRPYDTALSEFQGFSKDLLRSHEISDGTLSTRFFISDKASWAVKLAFGGDETVEEGCNPVSEFKAVKNSVEISGMRACHVRDGAALVEFLAWLEDQLVTKRTSLDEVAAADKLEQLRAKQKYFMGLAFPTISAAGANAAIIHYQPQRGACSIIDPNGIYLCDSGAQYLDGTTDTTRTVHFGEPTEAEKRAYTLVLKGHVALDMAVFPKGTLGIALDTLARQFLREDGLDYLHSTGHGVGSYLNVHEGPIGIGTRVKFAEAALQVGNVLSNEPGYYEDGAFGIRIENVAVVVEVETRNRFGGNPYMGFESLTMVPLCRNLIQAELLTDKEKAWLNRYHGKVFDVLKGTFADDPLTLAWLTRETRPF